MDEVKKSSGMSFASHKALLAALSGEKTFVIDPACEYAELGTAIGDIQLSTEAKIDPFIVTDAKAELYCGQEKLGRV